MHGKRCGDVFRARYGHGVFNLPEKAAFTYGVNPVASVPIGIPSNYALTVNDTGGFFNAGFSVGRRGYNGGTLRARATILIHEVAHLVAAPGFQKDMGLPAAGNANDALVDKNCRKLIEAL